MARQQRTEPKPPVDAEDNDRRLAPQVDAQPSVQQDEHRGLAGRILELRNTIEEQRLAGIQERAQLGQRMAQLEQQVSAMGARVDREVEAIQKTQQQLGNLEPASPVKAILNQASADALHAGLWSMAALLALGGVISAIGIRNPPAPAKRAPPS